MENFTHALAGLLAAELVVQLRSRREPAPPDVTWRRWAWFSSALANNLPDFDFLLVQLTPGKLGYLLQHRGYTHTVLLAAPLALCALALPWLWARFARWKPSRRDWRWLAALALLGPLLHVSMDALNNYGVHPFWPLYDGWFHADAVFIVEPWLWATALPSLYFAASARAPGGALSPAARSFRLAAASFGAVALCAVWLLGLVAHSMALLVTVLALLAIVLAARLRPLARVLFGVTATAGVALGLVALSSALAARVERDLSRSFPSEAPRDVVMTPSPGNPLCWDALTVSTGSGGWLILRRGWVTPLPAVFGPERCPQRLSEGGTAPFVAGRVASDDPTLGWRGELRLPLAELEGLARDRCEVAAFLRWARAPFWVRQADGWVVGDARYDHDPSLEFAEIFVPDRSVDCPHPVPPWATQTAAWTAAR